MIDILVVGARGIPGAEGGAEKHAENVFPQFAAAGYNVTLLGTRQFIRMPEYKGVKLLGIPTVNVASTEKFVYHFICFLYALFKRPRLVHLQGLNSGIFLFLYKLFGMNVVMRYGSADYEHAKWGLVGRAAFKLCEKQLKLADHVIAVSRKYERDLQARYGLKNLTVIPNGTDEVTITDASREFWAGLGLDNKRYILSVGRLTVDKRYVDMLAAMKRFEGTDVELVLVGGPDGTTHHEELKAMAGPNVRFLGRLDRELLPILYSRCAAYVSASAHEGLSNSILEAISFGSPLIASDIPANREMRLNEACYFRQGDAAALADKFAEALAEPKSMVVDRGAFVGWTEVFHETERVYHKVLKVFHPQGDRATELRTETQQRAYHVGTSYKVAIEPAVLKSQPEKLS
jgi:glycosyltransferase involved in cell wall biosynthesis